MRKFLMLMIAAILLPVSVSALGPATHMRESRLYVANLSTDPLPGEPRGDLTLLSDPANTPYLELGSIFPDLGRALSGSYFEPHDRDFGWHVFSRGVEEMATDPWKLAFGLGYLNHLTGDITAQDVMTQYYATRFPFGEMDVVQGLMDDHAGGENELVAEMWTEALQAELSDYTDLATFFFQAGRLTAVLDWYNELALEHFGPPTSKISVADQRTEALAWIRSWPMVIETVRANVADGIVAYAQMKVGLNAATALPSINHYELQRILDMDVFGSDYWDEYPSYFRNLGPHILRVINPSEHWYTDWPNWSAQGMIGGSIQGLCAYAADFSGNDRQVVFRAGFRDGGGSALVSFDRTNPPASFFAYAEVFNVYDDTVDIVVRVREDHPGLSIDDDPIVAECDVTIDTDLFDYSAVARDEIVCEVTPAASLDDVTGYTLEVARDDDPDGKSFFTSNFDLLRDIEEIDLDSAAYEAMFSTYDHYPRSLKIENPYFTVGWGTLWGRVTDADSGEFVEGALIATTGKTQDATNRAGWFQMDRIGTGQNVALQITATGYETATATVDVNAGQVSRVDVELTPIATDDDDIVDDDDMADDDDAADDDDVSDDDTVDDDDVADDDDSATDDDTVTDDDDAVTDDDTADSGHGNDDDDEGCCG